MRPSKVPAFAKVLYPQGVVHEIAGPPGYSAEEIGTLPTLRDHSQPRFPALRSYWQPSPEELAVLANGGYIELAVIAYSMVPVALNVIAPPEALL